MTAPGGASPAGRGGLVGLVAAGQHPAGRVGVQDGEGDPGGGQQPGRLLGLAGQRRGRAGSARGLVEHDQQLAGGAA